jgi:hypothetical protein
MAAALFSQSGSTSEQIGGDRHRLKCEIFTIVDKHVKHLNDSLIHNTFDHLTYFTSFLLCRISALLPTLAPAVHCPGSSLLVFSIVHSVSQIHRLSWNLLLS